MYLNVDLPDIGYSIVRAESRVWGRLRSPLLCCTQPHREIHACILAQHPTPKHKVNQGPLKRGVPSALAPCINFVSASNLSRWKCQRWLMGTQAKSRKNHKKLKQSFSFRGHLVVCQWWSKPWVACSNRHTGYCSCVAF